MHRLWSIRFERKGAKAQRRGEERQESGPGDCLRSAIPPSSLRLCAFASLRSNTFRHHAGSRHESGARVSQSAWGGTERGLQPASPRGRRTNAIRMTPLFTIHAGEYVVGEYLERQFKGCRVWVPSKDDGIDLLVTDGSCSRAASLQVKFSRDYAKPDAEETLARTVGWFQFKRQKIENSPANYWVLVLWSLISKDARFLVISPEELLRRSREIHGHRDSYNLFLSVIGDKQKAKCWEIRGVRQDEMRTAVESGTISQSRDFSSHLDDWSKVRQRISPDKTL